MFGAFAEEGGGREVSVGVTGEMSTPSGLAPAHYHYNAYWHSLEKIAPLPREAYGALLDQLPAGAFLIALTSGGEKESK